MAKKTKTPRLCLYTVAEAIPHLNEHRPRKDGRPWTATLVMSDIKSRRPGSLKAFSVTNYGRTGTIRPPVYVDMSSVFPSDVVLTACREVTFDYAEVTAEVTA